MKRSRKVRGGANKGEAGQEKSAGPRVNPPRFLRGSLLTLALLVAAGSVAAWLGVGREGGLEGKLKEVAGRATGGRGAIAAEVEAQEENTTASAGSGERNSESLPDGYVSTGHGRKPIPPSEEIARLPPDGGTHYNRLVFEQSPYLLQHAGNPVDWHPWGEEAFEKARREDKPVFLSIGYSTCHWCHVMEVESFENEEVAALMNRDFISIKVDREERPDIDQIYMAVTQAMTGSGGWPMTVVMTPDKKPFFAGTYFPRKSRYGRPGMLELLPNLARAWKTRRPDVLKSADEIAAAVGKQSAGSFGANMTKATLDLAFRQFSARFDSKRGGFSRGTKFPSPHNLSFLLRYWRRTGNAQALEMVETTLREMRRGGIFDHVGFGFHRYSTDPEWFTPHFEKMLYDQAMLAIAYIEAHQATGKEEYARTAREIFTYVLRDMTAPEGGFYSAEDADSEGEEGKFYVWSEDEIRSILGDEEGELYLRVYNTKARGNWNEGRKDRTNILHLNGPLGELAEKMESSEEELRARLEASRQKLFEVREKRVHPFKDDKILTDWNGLMVVALAKAGRVLDEPRYTQAARKAMDFILNELRDEAGRLRHRFRQGQVGLPAQVEDYAYVIWGLLELYEASFTVRYLEAAIELNETLIEHYWDNERGGFYQTADDGEKLLTRLKTIYDGARPSGNSVSALNLLKLGRITANSSWESKSEEIMRAFAGDVGGNPSAHAQLMSGLDFGIGPSYEIVIAGKEGADDTEAMIRALSSKFIPNMVVLFRPDGPEKPPISVIAEFTEFQKSLGGKATAYVCQNYACSAPTTDIAAMVKSIEPDLWRIR